jgi:hypothetical protein
MIRVILIGLAQPLKDEVFFPEPRVNPCDTEPWLMVLFASCQAEKKFR